jgi:hypothetical protein
MTGPEHYREAERLLALGETISEHGGDLGQLLPAAQVHATLALAAATAMNDAGNGMAQVDFLAWDKVAGVPPKGVTVDD